jgi:subtilisin family serine protease
MLDSLPDVDIVRTVKSRRRIAAMSARSAGPQETIVAKMIPERAEILKASAPPQVIVEEDSFLEYGSPPTMGTMPVHGMTRLRSQLSPKRMEFYVADENGNAVGGATVTLAGEGFPAEAETDASGHATLEFYTIEGRPPRYLAVKPQDTYWDRYITSPQLDTNAVNEVRLESIESTIPGFPNVKFGWGHKAVRLDSGGERLTGRGVKIAIVDSGADSGHPLLSHIERGRNLTTSGGQSTWDEDVVGHGSHCAGVITAWDQQTNKRMRGFAPQAEIHALKIFPGGQFSSLLEAIDYCIAEEIDVVNLSLGSPARSEAVEQTLTDAVNAGVACIVAAGNSGGPVQYPAASPLVLAVAAVGRLDEFPVDTWDSTNVRSGLVSADGLFSPAFTCFGPEIDLCAPGVGIVSTVPGGLYEPQSGTSMAAPHVTGIAALLLAHHPAFGPNGPFAVHNRDRVSTLFGMLQSMCQPVPFGPHRSGAGLPQITRVLAALPSSPDSESSPAESMRPATHEVLNPATFSPMSVTYAPIAQMPIGWIPFG